MANLPNTDGCLGRGAWTSDWARRADQGEDGDLSERDDYVLHEHDVDLHDSSAAARQEARTQAARFAQISAQLPCCVFQLECSDDGEVHFSFLGANCQVLCGVAWARLKQAPELLAERVAGPHQASFRDALQVAISERAPWFWEGPLQTQGPRRWLQVTAQPQPDDQRRGVCVSVGMLLDITDRKVNEAALERALEDVTEAGSKERLRAQVLRDTCQRLSQRNRSLEAQHEGWERTEKSAALARLALGLAHEINNPLAGVTYMFEALQSGTLPAERQGDYARSVEAGLLRIQGTTHSLLQYAQPTPPLLGRCAWPDIAAAALSRLQPALAARGLELQLELGRGRGAVCGDPRLLEEALTRVLLNAVHASAPGSLIRITLRRGEGRLGLTVHDHGTGIPAEYLDYVCDPFFTTKQQGEGTGLGLATATRMLQVQKGTLEIDSVEGEGTQVTLWAKTTS